MIYLQVLVIYPSHKQESERYASLKRLGRHTFNTSDDEAIHL